MVNYPFLAEFGMFTGIFVILFWSYQRLGNPDKDGRVNPEEKNEDHSVEYLTLDKDIVDLVYRKSETRSHTLSNDEESKAEIQYDANDSGSVLGTIEFPKLARKISIHQGTGELQLRNGAGHYEKSAKPGEMDHCVLVGDYETIFHGIETLMSGDVMVVKTSSGVFTYKVTEYQSTPLSKKIALLQCDFAKLTLTTAHPNAVTTSPTSRHTIHAMMISSVLN